MDASHDDFWTEMSSDPVAIMRKNEYDDVKFIDIEDADPVCAYQTVLWIKKHAYTAILRNCLDDVYDVLRAYGMEDLEWPSHDWFPKNWFAHFRGTQRSVADFSWNEGRPPISGGASLPDPDQLDAKAPDWRNPFRMVFGLFRAALFIDFFIGLFRRRRRRA